MAIFLILLLLLYLISSKCNKLLFIIINLSNKYLNTILEGNIKRIVSTKFSKEKKIKNKKENNH